MATVDRKLVGRVAQILNEREIVINLGQAQGVKTGMIFAVLTDPLEIKDPETGEVLDCLEREKARVRARDVRERIAVCRTYRKHQVPASRASIPFERFLPREEYERLEYLKEAAEEPNPYAEEYVKIGDRVALVEDPD